MTDRLKAILEAIERAKLLDQWELNKESMASHLQYQWKT